MARDCVEAPPDLARCDLGGALISVFKERHPFGWRVWGNYGCCGLILLDGLPEEPRTVLVEGRRFDITAR